MDLKPIIHFATLAPSGHNTQPWKFSASDNVIRIYADATRRLPVVDPDDHALYISLGCALENLVIAASEYGLTTKVEYLPDCLKANLFSNGNENSSALFRAIPLRQSNRSIYDGKPVAEAHLRELIDDNIFDGVEVKALRTNDPQIEWIIEFVKEATRLQFQDDAFVNELISWIRFSSKAVTRTADGLTGAALGFPSVPEWLGTFIMKTLVNPDGEAKKCEKAIQSSSLVFVFIARKNDRRHWVDVGRSFERVALTATSLGIAHAHLNMPCEVTPVRKKLASQLALDQDEQPLLLIRLGYANPVPHAPRRPIEEVLDAT